MKMEDSGASSKLTAIKGGFNTVGLDDDFKEITAKLQNESDLQLQIVAVVGMAGIGKSTLAQKVYKYYSETYKHFDTYAWVTVSHSYKKRQVLTGLLSSMRGSKKHHTNLNELEMENDDQLKTYLHQSLWGNRYLVVMDDVWDTKFWNDLRNMFPSTESNEGSRILLTARRVDVVKNVDSSAYIHHVNLLKEEDSWELLRLKVFGKAVCLPELVEFGKNIAKNCQGLPLSLVVIGGLLSKAPKTPDFWKDIAKNLGSVVIKNDEKCMKVISLSYTNLPSDLKDCFLYTSIFPQDFDIPVSKLVKLWVAEGFLKPLESKISEDVAYDYLLDLVDRSLILPGEWSSLGKIRTCKAHDIISEFCLEEAKKGRFFNIANKSLSILEHSSPQRLSIHPSTILIGKRVLSLVNKKLSSLQVRSLLSFDREFHDSVQKIDPRSVRVLDMVETVTVGIQGKLQEKLFCYLHYLACNYDHKLFSISSSCVFPNLQTLILRPIMSSFPHSVKVAIWNMPQLRHVQTKTLSLPDPQDSANSPFVLENLQTLSQVQNFKCSSEVLKRIPNLRKLGITYFLNPPDWQCYNLDNLERLHNLEALKCQFFEPSPSFLRSIRFPQALVKLTLEGCGLPWEDMGIVGSLCNLKVLKLKHYAFEGPKWEPKEEQFPELQYLLLEQLNLEDWKATIDHFPSLQHLIVRYCRHLKEIPRDILRTLQLVEVKYCADALAASVMKIEEKESEERQFRILIADSLWLNKEVAEEPETEAN